MVKSKILVIGLIGLFLFGIVPLVAAEMTIGYVVKSVSIPEDGFIEVIDELGVNYELIDDSDVDSTNFSEYDMILIGDQNIDDVPVNDFKSLIVNPRYYEDWSSHKGSVAGSQPLRANNTDTGLHLTEGLEGEFQVYTRAKFNGLSIPMYYLDGPKYNGAERATVLGDNINKYVVSYKDEPKRVFFGITAADYWTNESRQLFKQSLEWILDGEDVDGDGWSVLQGDCDDHDPVINPGNPDPFLNCINDAPIQLGDIPTLEWDQGQSFDINLNDYFDELEGETLTFGVGETSGDENITITAYPNGTINLVAEADWFGTDWVIFDATDGENIVLSNNVTLIVNEVIVDLIPPEVNLLAPLDGSVFNIRYVEFNFSVVDDIATELRCDLITNGEEGDEMMATNGTVESFSLENIADGLYFWNVKCSDGSNNAYAFGDFSYVIDAPDAPVIDPIASKIIYENESLEFAVTATDQENDSIVISAQNLPSGSSFDGSTFRWTPNTNQAGSYLVNFIAKDSNNYTGTEDVRITVLNLVEPEPEPDFDDIDMCEEINGDVIVNIKDPDDGDEFSVGETIEVDIEIENFWEDNLKFDVEVYLYNLDDDDKEVKEKASLKVKDDDEEKITIDLKIPLDLDDGDEYIIFVVAEDKEDGIVFCDQEYIDIDIERDDHNVVIESIELNPEIVGSGDNLGIDVNVKNIGTEDEDVSVMIEIEELGISEESEEFELEEFDDDDEHTFNFFVNIPYDAEEKDYEVKATVFFDDGDEENSEVQKFTVFENGFVETSGTATGDGSTAGPITALPTAPLSAQTLPVLNIGSAPGTPSVAAEKGSTPTSVKSLKVKTPTKAGGTLSINIQEKVPIVEYKLSDESKGWFKNGKRTLVMLILGIGVLILIILIVAFARR